MTGNTFIKSIVDKYDQEPNIIGNYTKEEKPQKNESGSKGDQIV